MDRPLVIVNPSAGGGLSEKRWAQLVGPLTDGLGPFDARFTRLPGDGRSLARDAVAERRLLVVAFGGDGTISEVADGLLAAGAATELGIIPRGTGGDFRRSLRLPDDVGEAGRRVRDGVVHHLDAGRVTFTADDGQKTVRHFVNVASFGFSSDVALRANRSSKRLGAKAAFLGATLRALMSYDNADVVFAIDGEAPRRATVLLGAVGNGRFFGGGMKICPEASLEDGVLDLVTVGDLGRIEILTKIHRLYDGTHLSMTEVKAARARSIDVSPVDPKTRIPLEIDGETPGRLPAKFEVLPGALKVRF